LTDNETKASASASLVAWLKVKGKTIDNIPDTDLVSFVSQQITASKRAKETYLEPMWLRNVYFFLGYQHIEWRADTRRFYPIPVSPDKRVTVNRIRSRVMQGVSQRVGHDPGYGAMPEKNDPDARASARMAEKALRYMYNQGRHQMKRIIVALLQELMGGAFVRARYDAHAGRPIVEKLFLESSAGDVLMDQEGSPIPALDPKTQKQLERVIDQGEVVTDIYNHMDVHIPPSARLPETGGLSWIGLRRAVPVDEIFNTYDERVSPDKRAVDISSKMMLDLGRFFGSADPLVSDDREADAAWLDEYHVPRMPGIKGFELGRKIIISQNKVLVNEKGDFPWLPFEYCPNIPHPFTLWAETSITDTIEPSMYYNAARGHIAKARTMLGDPLLGYIEGSINPDELASGLRAIKINPGFDKGVVPIPTGRLTEAHMADVNLAKSDVDDAHGSYGPGRGDLPGRSPQPVGTIQALQTADLGNVQPGMKITADAWARHGQNCLYLMAEYYDRPRFISLAGDEDDPEILTFTGSDLTGNFQIFVKEESELPHQKDALRTSLAEILKSPMGQQLFADPTAQGWLMSIFDMPDPSSFMAIAQQDSNAQEWEIRRIVAGEQIEIGPFDHHDTHLQVIARLTKNKSLWSSYPEEVRNAILQHAQGHVDAKQAELMQQFQEMQNLQAQAMGVQPGVQEPALPQG